MGDKVKIFSILSFLLGLSGIFFVGLIAGFTSIIFSSIAFEKYDDDSEETKAGFVLGLVNVCVMGLIIIGIIVTTLMSGHLFAPLLSWIFLFGPAGFCSMATGGIPIPIFFYY